MGDDEKLSKWMNTLDEEPSQQEGQGGPSGEMLRQAMAINPNLFKERKEEDVRQAVSAAQQKAQERSTKEDAITDFLPTDIVKTILLLEEKYLEERRQVKEEIARLQARERDLPRRVLDKIITSILTYDENMVSPKTLEILQMKKDFLGTVGFSARKVIERQMAAQKKRQ